MLSLRSLLPHTVVAPHLRIASYSGRSCTGCGLIRARPLTTTTAASDQAFVKSDNRGRWVENTYGGAVSFLRRRYTRDLTDVDVAVTGIPFDCAVTYRPGARLGPRAIRAASVQLAELKAFPFGFDPFDTLSVVDYGDCFLVSG